MSWAHYIFHVHVLPVYLMCIVVRETPISSHVIASAVANMFFSVAFTCGILVAIYDFWLVAIVWEHSQTYVGNSQPYKEVAL